MSLPDASHFTLTDFAVKLHDAQTFFANSMPSSPSSCKALYIFFKSKVLQLLEGPVYNN